VGVNCDNEEVYVLCGDEDDEGWFCYWFL
jgi:hypothetical protein